MQTNQPRRKSRTKEKQGRASHEPRPCRFLTPEEFADIKRRRDWDAIEQRYVRKKTGPAPTGAAKTPAERQRDYRRRMRGE